MKLSTFWIKSIFIILLVQTFLFYVIFNIIALPFWFEHHDEFTHSMNDWVVNYIEFGMMYWIVVFSGLICAIIFFFFLSGNKKKSQTTEGQKG